MSRNWLSNREFLVPKIFPFDNQSCDIVSVFWLGKLPILLAFSSLWFIHLFINCKRQIWRWRTSRVVSEGRKYFVSKIFHDTFVTREQADVYFFLCNFSYVYLCNYDRKKWYTREKYKQKWSESGALASLYLSFLAHLSNIDVLSYKKIIFFYCVNKLS